MPQERNPDEDQNDDLGDEGLHEPGNANLNRAMATDDDEFYTQLDDVYNELKWYKKKFENTIVYCNCDDPKISAFYHYFSYNFKKLGLKKLITTCYKNTNADLFTKHKSETAVKIVMTGWKEGATRPEPDDAEVTPLEEDGDFRSDECIELLKEADVVVTNPPFSLFREYVNLLNKEGKKFLIIGNSNAITTKEIFPLIKKNLLWSGRTNPTQFTRPDNTIRTFGNIQWFTNIDHKKRREELILRGSYNSRAYPKYDNYPDAISVDEVNQIPKDYYGVMGVPITFLGKHNPAQFEIIGLSASWDEYGGNEHNPRLNGDGIYRRLFIRRTRRRKNHPDKCPQSS